MIGYMNVIVGEESGVINVYDPRPILSGSPAVALTRIAKHKSKVLCSDFSGVDKGKHLLGNKLLQQFI